MVDRDEKGKFKDGHEKIGGRKKNSISINDELRKLLATKDKNSKRKYVEVLARKIFNDALKGNDRLIIELWQQIDGRAKQSMDIDMDVKSEKFNIMIKQSEIYAGCY